MLRNHFRVYQVLRFICGVPQTVIDSTVNVADSPSQNINQDKWWEMSGIGCVLTVVVFFIAFAASYEVCCKRQGTRKHYQSVQSVDSEVAEDLSEEKEEEEEVIVAK